jgi:hypothetical protein
MFPGASKLAHGDQGYSSRIASAMAWGAPGSGLRVAGSLRQRSGAPVSEAPFSCDGPLVALTTLGAASLERFQPVQLRWGHQESGLWVAGSLRQLPVPPVSEVSCHATPGDADDPGCREPRTFQQYR